jgi:hypothetical protein
VLENVSLSSVNVSAYLNEVILLQAERTFLNRQLGMKVYTKLVMIMELE